MTALRALGLLAVMAAACGDGAGGGTGTCLQLFECTQKCSDPTCEATCTGKASARAQQLANAVAACMGSGNCPAGDEGCLQQACSAQLTACAADVAPVPPASAAPAPQPGPVPGPGPAELVSQAAGTWERSASAADGGYVRWGYVLDPTGSYTFKSERWFGHLRADEWHLTQEQGTWSVSADQLTLAPASTRGTVVDGNGAVLKTFDVPVEKTTYAWKKHLFEGIGETQLVLTPPAATQRDGDFGGNADFPASYLFSPNRTIEWRHP